MPTDAEIRLAQTQRTIANMVTDEMLTTKVDELTVFQTAVLQAALNGPFGEEIIARLDKLKEDSIGAQ